MERARLALVGNIPRDDASDWLVWGIFRMMTPPISSRAGHGAGTEVFAVREPLLQQHPRLPGLVELLLSAGAEPRRQRAHAGNSRTASKPVGSSGPFKPPRFNKPPPPT
eukprot:4507334-Pyramimonas_sp.AAC.1